MTRIRATALVALSTLALPISIVCGQTTVSSSNANPTSNQGSATERSVPTCQAAPGSRVRKRDQGDCAGAGETTILRMEQQINVTLELPQPEAVQCAASALTEYEQRNDVARVTGTVSIANCPAGSAGTFDVVARVREESGEIKSIELAEQWQRDEAGNAPFTGDYPIGENVELINVRVRNLKCTCAAVPEAAPVEAAQPN